MSRPNLIGGDASYAVSGASSGDASCVGVAREDTHEGERKHMPVNALLSVELHVPNRIEMM